MYVVYYCEHMRDGQEDGAAIVRDVAEALAVIDKIANGFAGSNHSFKLFKLGEEIPLDSKEVEEPKVVQQVKRTKFFVKGCEPEPVPKRKRGRR